MKKAIVILLAIFLFGTSFYTVSNYNKNNAEIVKNSNAKTVNEKLADSIKVKAADFKLKDLNGKEVSLSNFKGKKIYLNFWATWCPPCKAEMPDIEKLYQETKNSDLVILTINLGEDKQTVKSFMDENKYSFNVLLDSDQEVAIKYNIVSIPTSFFIDEKGTLISKKIGPMNIDEMKSYIN
jgi:thiol-disulfide isomerase/thioredoxin